MKTRNLIGAGCLLAFALVIAGCSGGVTGSPIGPPPPPAPGPSASISFCDMASCTPGTTFSVRGVKHLGIRVSWSNLPAGEHGQSVRILMPDGSLYAQLHGGVGEGTSATVENQLNIKGTAIWSMGLTGAWRVEAYLNDGTTPVATATLNLTE